MEAITLPGTAVLPGSVIEFTMPDGSELAPRNFDQGYTVDINGARWRGVLVGVHRALDATLTVQVKLLDSTPIGYGPAS